MVEHWFVAPVMRVRFPLLAQQIKVDNRNKIKQQLNLDGESQLLEI